MAKPATVQIKFRIPATIRAEIEDAAWRNHRSINGEILARLELAAKLLPPPPDGPAAYHVPAEAVEVSFRLPGHDARRLA